MKRKLILAVIIVFLVAGGIGAWKYFEKTDDLVKVEPAAKLNAMQLIEAFSKDTAGASRMYLNKVVEVTGTIVRLDSTAVELGEKDNLSVVVVGIDDRHLQDVKNLKPGETITLQGECTGYETGGGDDLLADLGTKVEIKAAGVKKKQ